MKHISEIVAKQLAQLEPATDEAARRMQVRAEAEVFLAQFGFNLANGLPKGEQGNSTECVLANALGGSFGRGWVLPQDRLAYKLGYTNVDLPAGVQEFIARFDAGEYPDLIA